MTCDTAPLLYQFLPRRSRRAWCRGGWRRGGWGRPTALATPFRKACLAIDRHLAPLRLQKRHHGYYLKIAELAPQGRHTGLITLDNINSRLVQGFHNVLGPIRGLAFIALFLDARFRVFPRAGQVRAALTFLANLVTQGASPLAIKNVLK